MSRLHDDVMTSSLCSKMGRGLAEASAEAPPPAAPGPLAPTNRYKSLEPLKTFSNQINSRPEHVSVSEKVYFESNTMRCCVAALCVSALTTLAVAAAAEDAHPDPASQNDNDLELTEEDKRAWANLHGGWGKRGWQDMSSAWGKRAWQDLNSAWGKRAWQDLNSAWGKRAWQDLNSAWGKRGWNDMSQAWGKRGWQDLNSAWGKRAWQDLNSAWGKRAWQDLNSAWGKRAWQDLNSAAWGKRAWQDMSSAWGKRAPEKWANFHGSWGKRSGTAEPDYEEIDAALEQILPPQPMEDVERLEAPEKKAWQTLHGAWGKRPAKQAHYNGGAQYYWKREPGWTNLRGMWGKRSEPALDADNESSGARDEA